MKPHKFFKHDSLAKTIWRIGRRKLLKEIIEAGLRLKSAKSNQRKRVNVETTVQEKEVRFPTDARLYDRARQRFANAPKERKIPLRQNYNRNAKKLLLKMTWLKKLGPML